MVEKYACPNLCFCPTTDYIYLFSFSIQINNEMFLRVLDDVSQEMSNNLETQ